MAQDNTSEKPVPIYHRRNRTIFTSEQLKILINTFDKSPYPSYSTKQKLAMEINIEESRIQVWFQNRRARYKLQIKTESSQGQEQDDSLEQMQGKVRQSRIRYSSAQLQVLLKAFTNNPYPGVNSRELLAKEIGVPESKVQIWFQNRRSKFHKQRKREPDESLEKDQEQSI